MKRSFLIALCASLPGVLVLQGCSSPQSDLIGKWHKTVNTNLTVGDENLEFFKDGTVILNDSAFKYVFIDDHHIRFDSVNGSIAGEFQISGERLTFKDSSGRIGQYERTK